MSEDEATLLSRLCAGDEAAYRLVVSAYHGSMLRVARAVAGAAAEDVVQEAWIKAIRALPTFEKRSSLRPWLLSIVRNEAISRLRKEKRAPEFETLDGDMLANRYKPDGGWQTPPSLWSSETPEALLAAKETRAVIDKTIETLPALQHAVLTLKDIEGLSFEEICNILEISASNARVLLHRARRGLWAAIDDHARSREGPMPKEEPRSSKRGAHAALALCLAASLAACATPPKEPEALQAYKEANDPLEPTNRDIFGANLWLDRNALKPAAEAYGELPEFMRNRLHNVAQTLGSPGIFVNDVLQGEAGLAADTFTRLVMNLTLGVAGTFDAAGDWAGIERHEADFGQTLGVWGVGEGPYLMLPLFGPSNPRDTVGRVVTGFMDPLNYYIGFVPSLGRGAGEGIDVRQRNLTALDELQRTSLDFYATLRSLYRQRREALIRHGKPENVPAPAITREEAPSGPSRPHIQLASWTDSRIDLASPFPRKRGSLDGGPALSSVEGDALAAAAAPYDTLAQGSRLNTTAVVSGPPNRREQSVAFRLGSVQVLGDGPSYFEEAAGAFNIDEEQSRRNGVSPAGSVELRYGKKLFGIGPAAGILANTDGGLFGYAGFYSDIEYERFVVTPLLGLGGYKEGGSTDLGGTFQFRLQLEIAYRLDNGRRLGLRIGHISNAGINDSNPGEEDLMVTYAIPLSF